MRLFLACFLVLASLATESTWEQPYTSSFSTACNGSQKVLQRGWTELPEKSNIGVGRCVFFVLSDGEEKLSRLGNLQDTYCVKSMGFVRKKHAGFISRLCPPCIQRLSCCEQEGWPARTSWTVCRLLASLVAEDVMSPCWSTEAILHHLCLYQ